MHHRSLLSLCRVRSWRIIIIYMTLAMMPKDLRLNYILSHANRESTPGFVSEYVSSQLRDVTSCASEIRLGCRSQASEGWGWSGGNAIAASDEVCICKIGLGKWRTRQSILLLNTTKPFAMNWGRFWLLIDWWYLSAIRTSWLHALFMMLSGWKSDA